MHITMSVSTKKLNPSVIIIKEFGYLRNVTTSDLKINLTPPDGVVSRFKMLTYHQYAALFHRLTPCQWAPSSDTMGFLEDMARRSQFFSSHSGLPLFPVEGLLL